MSRSHLLQRHPCLESPSQHSWTRVIIRNIHIHTVDKNGGLCFWMDDCHNHASIAIGAWMTAEPFCRLPLSRAASFGSMPSSQRMPYTVQGMACFAYTLSIYLSKNIKRTKFWENTYSCMGRKEVSGLEGPEPKKTNHAKKQCFWD